MKNVREAPQVYYGVLPKKGFETLDDQELIQRIRDGDVNAFSLLVEAHQNKVYGLCLRMTENKEDAFDLSQDIFLRVFRSLDTYKSEAAFATWLYRLSMNVCIDHLRKRKKWREHFRPLANEEREIDWPDLRYLPESEWDKKELREAIARAMMLLSAEHRAVIILRDIQQLPYMAIAEILGCEEGTVKSRLSRARDALRRILTEKGNFFEERTSKRTEKR